MIITNYNNDIDFEHRLTVLEMEHKNLDEKLDTLATKTELKIAFNELSNALIATKTELSNDIFSNKLELKSDATSMELRLINKIDSSVNKMIWRLGGIIVAYISFYPFILKYLGLK